MPGWDSEQYEMQGEDFDHGGGTVVGIPEEVRIQDGYTRGGTSVGPQLAATIRRTDGFATKDIPWTWGVSGAKERDNWSIVGTRAVHAENKKLNASTDLGKLFASVKNHLPAIDGFDPLDAKSWAGLAKLPGNIEWGWLEEPVRVQDPVTQRWGPVPEYVKAADGKLVKNPDYRPKRTMVVVGYDGGNGQVHEDFDLATLGLTSEQLNVASSLAADTKDRHELTNKLMQHPDLRSHAGLKMALSNAGTGEALRVALQAEEVI